MKKTELSNRKQGFSIIIIIFVLVSLTAASLYYYSLKLPVPEVEITEKPLKAEIAPEEKVVEEKKPISQVHLSSNKLEQGNTLLIKIENSIDANDIKGRFGATEINFLETAAKELIAIVGVDVKKEPGNYSLVINFPEEQIKKDLQVVKRDFPITELVVTEELEEKGYSPTKIVENITTKENLILNNILSSYTPEAYFDQAFTYPLEKIEVVGAYGNIRKSGAVSAQHLGVDLDAELGTRVYAVNSGKVIFSQELNTYGKTLIIDHGLGIFSLYLHLDEFTLSEGSEAKKDEVIGLSGNTGYSIAPHLHFSIKANGASVDPLRFIKAAKEAME